MPFEGAIDRPPAMMTMQKIGDDDTPMVKVAGDVDWRNILTLARARAKPERLDEG